MKNIKRHQKLLYRRILHFRHVYRDFASRSVWCSVFYTVAEAPTYGCLTLYSIYLISSNFGGETTLIFIVVSNLFWKSWILKIPYVVGNTCLTFLTLLDFKLKLVSSDMRSIQTVRSLDQRHLKSSGKWGLQISLLFCLKWMCMNYCLCELNQA